MRPVAVSIQDSISLPAESVTATSNSPGGSVESSGSGSMSSGPVAVSPGTCGSSPRGSTTSSPGRILATAVTCSGMAGTASHRTVLTTAGTAPQLPVLPARC